MSGPSTTAARTCLPQRARALIDLWSGDFGQQYTARNAAETARSGVYHAALCQALGARSALEVGCNIGLNLTRMTEAGIDATGVDVNGRALETARRRLPGLHFVEASAYDLPFDDASFDLVFTCGVLIHIPPESRPRALDELLRVSRRYVWLGEYYRARETVIPYRGQPHALWGADFGAQLLERCPDARLLEKENLGSEHGFDELTCWLFEKASCETRDHDA